MIILLIACRNPTQAKEVEFLEVQKTLQRAIPSQPAPKGVSRWYSSIEAFAQHLEKFPELLKQKIGEREVSLSYTL